MLRQLNCALTSISDSLHLVVSGHKTIEWICRHLNERGIIKRENRCMRAHLVLQGQFIWQSWIWFVVIVLILHLLIARRGQRIEILSWRHHELLLLWQSILVVPQKYGIIIHQSGWALLLYLVYLLL